MGGEGYEKSLRLRSRTWSNVGEEHYRNSVRSCCEVTVDSRMPKGLHGRRTRGDSSFRPGTRRRISPLSGVFIREHARAASLYNDVCGGLRLP